jgi:hypothetical protein
MLRAMLSKGLAATAGGALLSGVFALSASAAEPANQACVGETVSALAGPGFGQVIASVAQDNSPFDTAPGLGDGIQRLQAGVLPDSFVPNTCNDG